jgi:hypothetical protein
MNGINLNKMLYYCEAQNKYWVFEHHNQPKKKHQSKAPQLYHKLPRPEMLATTKSQGPVVTNWKYQI